MPDDPPQDLVSSAEAGDPEAQNALGHFYAGAGSAAETAQRADTWFRRAAAQGLLAAKHNLGVMAFRAGERDRALAWFREASDEGWLNSTVALAGLLEGAGRLREAVRCYEIAARKGHANAQDALGRIALDLDTPEGYEASRYWSELASAQGAASADTRLGTIYHEGLGVERDPQRAAAYFLRAARAGHARARLMIGVAYDIGAGVEVDRVEAAFWLSLSAAEDSVAQCYIEKYIEPALTDDQRAALAARLQAATQEE